MASAYAARHLKGRHRGRFALAHYLLVGEKRGYWPNPFFDPVSIRDGRIPNLGEYLRRPALWDISPSRFFAAEWYRNQERCQALEKPPLQHFWPQGFLQGKNPSPDFDCVFFKEVVGVYRPDKEEFAYECLGQQPAEFPRTEKELLIRQARFAADIDMQILKRPASPRYSFLVFIQASHAYVDPFAPADRRFDVLINCYDSTPDNQTTADYRVFQRGTKTTAIHKCLTDWPDLFRGYNAVLFLDDDIEISTVDVNRLFEIFEAHGLDLAQPSLTEDSFSAFRSLKQPGAGKGIRALTAIEIMMPVISKRALEACGDVFGEGISGWGIDLLLSARVRDTFGETIALIADVVAAHRRDVDLVGGALYGFLRKYGIEASQETARISRHFGTCVTPDAIKFVDPPFDLPNDSSDISN